jgi:hypothetical protein
MADRDQFLGFTVPLCFAADAHTRILVNEPGETPAEVSVVIHEEDPGGSRRRRLYTQGNHLIFYERMRREISVHDDFARLRLI